MDLKQIQELIRFVSKAGVTEVSLEQGDFKITIKTQSDEDKARTQIPYQQVYQIPQQPAMQQRAPQTTHHATEARTSEGPSPSQGAPAADESNVLTIKSPMIGTFYRKPSPDKEPFIKVGDKVTKGQVVGVIEAMKLFNEIESEISGKVIKILVDDTSPVEYDQPLFLLEP